MNRFVISGAVLIALQLVVCQSSEAQTYSVEDSSVDTTGAFYFGDEILSPGLPVPGFVLGSGAGMPGGFAVEVDGFTYGRHFMINPQNPFPVLVDFSVDAASPSTGVAGSGVFTEFTAGGALEVNYDVFRTTIPGTNFQLHDGNGVGPGGTAFPLGMAEPQGPHFQPFRTGTDGYDSRSGPGPDIYWTWDSSSALPGIPPVLGGTPSGADVVISASASGYALGGSVFAPGVFLGLDSTPGGMLDNIDALEVFDLGTIGVFDTPDVILFSLEPGSPSLLGPSPYTGGSAADIFFATGSGFFGTSIAAPALGLTSSDNVTALSVSIPEPSTTLICVVAFGLAAAKRRRRI